MKLIKLYNEIKINKPFKLTTNGEYWKKMEDYNGTDPIYVVNKIKNDNWLLSWEEGDVNPSYPGITYENRPWAKQFGFDKLEDAFKYASRFTPGTMEIELPYGDILFPTDNNWEIEFG
jgi:hypothetical protein